MESVSSVWVDLGFFFEMDKLMSYGAWFGINSQGG